MGRGVVAVVCALAALSCSVVGCGGSTTAASSSRRCNVIATVDRHANVWSGFGFDETFLYYPVFDDDPSAGVSLGPAEEHDHAIWRVPLAGGNAARVWSGRTGIFGAGLAVTRGFVYVPGQRGALFPEAGLDNVVWRVPSSGGEATLVATFVSKCAPYGGIATDSTNLFFAQIGCGTYGGGGYLGRVSLDGGPATQIWRDQDARTFGSFALSGSTAFFYLQGDGGGVFAVPAAASAPPKLVFGSANVTGMAVSETDVFVAADAKLYVAGRDGAAARTLTDTGPMRHLVVLADDVWGLVTTGTGPTAQTRIMRVPIRGGPVQVLETDAGRVPSALSVHDGSLYWMLDADRGGETEIVTMLPCR